MVNIMWQCAPLKTNGDIKMKKTILKFFATLLVVANLFALTSCANTSWVAKAGDDTVPAGVYLNYLIDAYYSAAYSVENQQIDMLLISSAKLAQKVFVTES